MAVATIAPTTMPSSTEMLAMKPLAYLAMSMMQTRTSAEIPMSANGAYFGLGTLAARASPLGAGGTAPAMAFTSASHLAWSGLTMLGAVGPKGLPKTQLMPTRIRLMPMTRMTVPVTTGGKKRSMRLTKGAIRMDTTPAPMTAPKMVCAPVRPGVLVAMLSIGDTAAKVTPIITGRRMPNHCVAPQD